MSTETRISGGTPAGTETRGWSPCDRALTPAESLATLEVGRRVAFEAESGPKELRTAKITIMLWKRLQYCG
jgi:hypothetical protein